MFKVGDLVKIKCLAEIAKIDRQLHLNLPDSSITKCYCGKIGKVTQVDKTSYDKIYVIRLNITKNYSWYDVELTSCCKNFIPLQLCLS